MADNARSKGLKLDLNRLKRDRNLQVSIVVIMIGASMLAYALMGNNSDPVCDSDSCLINLHNDSVIDPEVVAMVNGERMYLDDLTNEINLLLFVNGIPESYASQISKETYLNQSIMKKLLYDEAVRNGFGISRAQAEEGVMQLLGGTENAITQFKESIENRSFDYDYFLDYFAQEMAVNKFLNETLLGYLTVTDNETRSYYDANPEAFIEDERIRASHILVNTSEEARAIISELESGANFSDLAKNRSIGPSSVNGGDLGYFERGMMVPEFEEAAFALEKVGNYTKEPVHTQFGYHVILLTDRQEARNLSFEEVSENLKQQLLQQKKNLVISTYLQSLLADQDIRIYLENEQATGTGIPSTDKPVVELFVMAYCPYGTQIEKGILPVTELLGDTIDFEVKFCDYAMHGKKELDEELRQYCIEENQNDKYLSYLECFLEDGDYESCIDKAGLDREDLEDCINVTDASFGVTDDYKDKTTWKGNYPSFGVYQNDVDRYGVAGSPTLVINGATVQSSRDSASLLGTICAAFTSAPPECAESMSSATPAPGFGFSSEEGSSEGGCGA